MQEMLWGEIEKSRCLKYQVAYHLYQDQPEKVLPLIDKYSSKLTYMLDYLSRSSPLRHF